MARWQPNDVDNDEARNPSGPVPVASDPLGDDAADMTMFDLVPHPVFVVAVDGDADFRFIYTNDAYRRLLGNDAATGDLPHVVPANPLVAPLRAFPPPPPHPPPPPFQPHRHPPPPPPL